MGYTLCLIPIVLLTGPFLPDLFVSFLVISFITLVIKYKEWNYFKNKYFIYFIIFYFYFVFSSLISKNILFSLESSLFYFRFGIFSFAIWYILEENQNILKRFTLFLFFAFTVAIIDGYHQYFIGENIFGLISDSPNRMTLLLNDNMILGGYLSRLFPFLFALIILNYSSNRNYIYLIFGFLILIDCLTFLSGERTALGLLVIATLLILFLTNKFKLLRVLSLIASLLIIIYIANSNVGVKQRTIGFTITQMNLNENLEDIKYLSDDHESLSLIAYEMYKDLPIFGFGPKQFRIHCADYLNDDERKFCTTHPHNSYLQLASETGTIGVFYILIPFCILIWFMIRQFYYLHINKKAIFSDYQVCLIITIFLSLWPIFPTLNFFNNWINVIYYLPVGFYLHYIHTGANKYKIT